MYYYKPPKAAIWGHRLGRMPAPRARAALDQFLSTAAARFEFKGAMLTLGEEALSKSLADALSVAAPCSYLPIALEQSEAAVDLIGSWEAETNSHPEIVMLMQSFHVHEWLDSGHPEATESVLNMFYGLMPCISTHLQFETIERFEAVRALFASAGLGKLNEKHLKLFRTSKPRAKS